MCIHNKTKVVDVRATQVRGCKAIRRIRVCRGCEARFTTYELFDAEIMKKVEQVSTLLPMLTNIRDRLETARKIILTEIK